MTLIPQNLGLYLIQYLMLVDPDILDNAMKELLDARPRLGRGLAEAESLAPRFILPLLPCDNPLLLHIRLIPHQDGHCVLTVIVVVQLQPGVHPVEGLLP